MNEPILSKQTSKELYEKVVPLVRIMVGAVFLSEGIQKFLFSDSLGVGRFIKIGIPAPEIMAPFVGAVEIVCGGLLLLGFSTRLAAIPPPSLNQWKPHTFVG